MLLRIRSPLGQVRIEIEKNSNIQNLKSLEFGQDGFDLYLDPKYTILASFNSLKHGDLIYANLSLKPKCFVEQDQIDNLLEKLDASIKRSRDPFCKHSFGMCDYCMPLSPYDQEYLNQNKIKHMSFHSYLRKIRDTGKIPLPTSSNFVPPLDEPNFLITDPCPGKIHGPYPDGICSKCQPSAISLQSQSYRMVDHVEFESPTIIESFLQYWRQTGNQRFGYLYGKYQQFDQVPLGVKALVCAIYEPPQDSQHDWIQLRDDDDEANVEKLASQLGLVKVGCIFTDLFDDGTSSGSVICKRHADSYFLSSQECIMASQMQHKYRVPCKYSSSGFFGSRFVTCVLSGNEKNQIDIMSYQVSSACQFMAVQGIIEPSVEPSLMRVKPTTKKQYIPEVFYTYKNEYNIQVRSAAEPTFPVEYLLVTVTHGFPSSPDPLFTNTTPFPIENRIIESKRNMSSLRSLLAQSPLLEKFSDFHALLFISETGIFDTNLFEKLCKAVTMKSNEMLEEIMKTESWATFGMILAEDQHQASESSRWSCRHCTFSNQSGNECEMCGLPKD